MRIAGLIVLIIGILALAYGGFSYTKETHEAKLGPLQVSVNEKQHVNVPVWAGVVLAVAGAGILVAGGKK